MPAICLFALRSILHTFPALFHKGDNSGKLYFQGSLSKWILVRPPVAGLVGDEARGRGLGSGLSFTSWPQVQLGTQPGKLPAGAPLLCPVGQRSSLPALFQPHPWVWSHCHELLREGGQLEPVLRGRGFPGSLPRGGDPPPEAASPRLLRGPSRFYGSSSGALIAVSIVSGLSVGESGD